MNLPNKLTIFRVILIPFFIVFLLVPDMPFLPSTEWGEWIALAIFVIASLTDMLDGKIARKYNLITDFGKFMDPLADKCLVMAALCWFVETGDMVGWVLAAVLLREFAVSGMRLIAVEKGRVIAAGWSGKVKTAATMVCVVLMFLPIPPVVNTLCVWVITLTTLYSGVEYFVKNKDVIASA